MRVLILLLLSFPLFAARSLVLTANNATIQQHATITPPHDYRIEFVVHSGTTPLPTFPINTTTWANGFYLQGYSTGGATRFFWTPRNLTGASSSNCDVNVAAYPSSLSIWRVQHSETTKTVTCEVWDSAGTLQFTKSITYTSATYTTNGTITLNGNGISFGYFRIHTTILPLNSQTPLVADSADVLMNFKFEDDILDSGTNSYTMSLTTPAYGDTLSMDSKARIKVGATTWSDWTSMRAGYPATLDGTSSYSQSDTSSGVTCLWTILKPYPQLIKPRLTNPRSCTATLEGTVFGDYHIQLIITDTDDVSKTATLHVGAVATDDNGVVIPSDPNVTKIFGEMIAFGKNPWGYTDERALAAMRLRLAQYYTLKYDDPTWDNPRTGTVSYITMGATPLTTLDVALAPTDTTVTVVDASRLNLTGLPATPARICVGTSNFSCAGGAEEIRICAQSGNILTVCFDGRGSNGVTPVSLARGTNVGQNRISGSGTLFVTDPAGSPCAGGAPGPGGSVIYSTGQVDVVAGNATVEGVGTTWNATNNVYGGNTRWIRIEATRGGGVTSFVFWAKIATLTDTNTLVLARSYAAGGDSGRFNYKIIGVDDRMLSLGFTRLDGTSTLLIQYNTGCESETAMYAKLYMGNTEQAGVTHTGKTYSYKTGLGDINGAGYGPNFYGEGLAARALYYRSGLEEARTAANIMDGHYVRDPEVTTAACSTLRCGGAYIGAIAAIVLDPSGNPKLEWGHIRHLIGDATKAPAIYTCPLKDSRDHGYFVAFAALGSMFDPDTTPVTGWRAIFTSRLQANIARDQTCQGTDGAFGNVIFNTSSSPALTLTTGSAVATGVGLTPSNSTCNVTVMGTGTATNGSELLYGSGFTSGSMITVTGTRSGSTFSAFYAYTGTTSPITLAGVWPGDNGTVSWAISNSTTKAGVGSQHADPTDPNKPNPELFNNWVCRYDSSTQITLHRPWTRTGITNGRIWAYNTVGYGQQPYMMGIRLSAFRWGSLNSDPTIAAGYAGMTPLSADWFYTTGYDPYTKGLFYGRIYEACEPPVVAPLTPAFYYASPGCSYGSSAREAARSLTPEGLSAVVAKYLAVPTTVIRDWGDEAYGAVFGNPAYTTTDYYSDEYYVSTSGILSDTNLSGHKWPGFFFGMGMAHQWPAIRLGGVTASNTYTVSVGFSLPSGSSKMQTIITAPNGTSTTTTCTSSPCNVTVDKTQGDHVMVRKYLSSGDVVRGTSEPTILRVR